MLLPEQNLIIDVLDNLPVPMLVLDRDGRIIQFNKTCQVVTGYDFKSMQGTARWLHLVPAEERIGVEQVLSALRSNQSSQQHENHWRQKNGSKRLFKWYYTVLNNKNNQIHYIICIGFDITEQRKMQQLAQLHLVDISQQQRLLSVNECISFISHEISQPLTSILLFADATRYLLDSDPPDLTQVTDNLQQVSRQALHASKISKQLGNSKRQFDIKNTKLNLNALVGKACELIRPRAENSQICLQRDLCETLSAIEGVIAQLELVLLNLLNNAIESIQDAGHSSGTICLETRQDNNLAHVVVRDSGPGVDNMTAAKLFKTLYTSKDYGLGVNLRVCRRLIENHGGRLWVEPCTTAGIFHFVLPLNS
jgi:PAS domain S-box-containing protein